MSSTQEVLDHHLALAGGNHRADAHAFYEKHGYTWSADGTKSLLRRPPDKPLAFVFGFTEAKVGPSGSRPGVSGRRWDQTKMTEEVDLTDAVIATWKTSNRVTPFLFENRPS